LKAKNYHLPRNGTATVVGLLSSSERVRIGGVFGERGS
jgi:hypothetical protein